MSTVIKSSFLRTPLTLTDENGRTVGVSLRGERTTICGSFNRTGLLDAVQSELGVRLVPDDAIVIDKADLPPVSSGDGTRGATRSFLLWDSDTYDSLMADARALIALAEHRKVHPPVDEAQVKALARLIDVQDPDVIARAILRSGKVTVTL
ncbi:hypothetical protein DDP54_15750 (plasmid) [Cellulomonas sp. WB94]|uniref:hypothetical protein n=1 Tax=Cellulomonas sp. WB94 TaxID=2173174 RepID=UPI000D58351E|nr:hypothetical protein [Cellulomonas sp. WB94]PVU81353.1 hypothetical protein DDP54_15750 [Cellulomonas sp. WB94]